MYVLQKEMKTSERGIIHLEDNVKLYAGELLWQTKIYGQSFLKDKKIAKEIVNLGEITKEDTVLEVGGGLGILTEELARCAGHVYVIEIEHGLFKALQDRFQDHYNLDIIEGNALTLRSGCFVNCILNKQY